jgi:hypothetical protein
VKPEQKQRKTKDRLGIDQIEEVGGADPFCLFSGAQVPVWDCWPIADLYIEPVAADNLENAKIPVYCNRDVLAWCIAVLSTSPTARLMIKEAMNLGWQMGLEDLRGHDFHLDVPEKIIMIDNNGLIPSALGNSEYFRNIILISMIRALRDVWHEKRYGGFEKYGAEAILMLERARAADCDVLSVLCAWELRSDGHSRLWRHLIGTDEGDLALSFSTYLEKDPSSLFTGKALAATFRQWYHNEERSNACDHETLEYLDTLILSSNGENPFGNTELTPVGLELISCLPDKTAYLQRQGREILSDPLYAGLSDPINQSHFMHMMYDLQVTYVQGVPFRDPGLADKIFPGGQFTPEQDALAKNS